MFIEMIDGQLMIDILENEAEYGYAYCQAKHDDE
jgi:hypothetical protein